jgi:heat shock protein HslJ
VKRFAILILALVSFACCSKKPHQDASVPPPSLSTTPPPSSSAVSIEDRTWVLVALGELTNPLGNGGRPATLRLEKATGRASGNAGCNRYSGPYTLRGDSLTFGPAISTKMACAEGMELENAWLGAHSSFVTWSATDSTLTLHDSRGALARFRPE